MTIYLILLALLTGIALGYLVVRNNQIIKGFLNGATAITIYILIFTMGLAVGFNKALISNFLLLGWQSIFIALSAMLGSMVVAISFYRLVNYKKR